MLNRQSSSSKKNSPAPSSTAKSNEHKRKKKMIKKYTPPRSPLLDLNNGRFSRNNSTSTTTSVSSSMSIEAPKGCLRFFKPSPVHLHKPKTLTKKSVFRSKENSDLKQKDASFNHLTPVGKLVCGFGVNCVVDDSNLVVSGKQNSGNSSKTPPVEASVSPEIQFGFSSIKVETITTPNSTCYGAGHVVSGVSDRRKCRPRGVLTVDSSAIDDSYCSSANNTRRNSFIPLPAEASVNWLLSPCKENEEDHTSTSNASRFRKSVDLTSSPSSIYNSGKYGSTGKFSSNKKTTRITLLSPRTPPEFQGLAGLSFEEVVGRLSTSVSQNEITPVKEDSSISIDCLGSGNVIQTPKSNDSTSGEKRWDPLGLSFRFANLNRSSWTCNNSSESSQTRISWREGLASRLYEMDESDCSCRCLSDNELEENENTGCLGKYDNEEHGKGKILSDEGLNISAESLCIDADSLVASGDSDWTLCYKNDLFQL